MAKELKLSGNHEEVKAAIEPLQFWGVNGDGLVLTDVRFGEAKDGTPQLELVADASSVKEPFRDAEPIETMTLSAVVTLKNDQQTTLNIISDSFGLSGEERLVDDREDFLRLHPEHPKSVYKKVVGVPSKSLYFKPKVAAAADGTVKAIYFNVSSPPQRESAGSSKLADLRKRFKLD